MSQLRQPETSPIASGSAMSLKFSATTAVQNAMKMARIESVARGCRGTQSPRRPEPAFRSLSFTSITVAKSVCPVVSLREEYEVLIRDDGNRPPRSRPRDQVKGPR